MKDITKIIAQGTDVNIYLFYRLLVFIKFMEKLIYYFFLFSSNMKMRIQCNEMFA